MHFDRHFHCHHRTTSDCECCPPPYLQVVTPPHSIHKHTHRRGSRHRTDAFTSDESDSTSSSRHGCHHGTRIAPKESSRYPDPHSCYCAYSYDHSPHAKHTYCHQICATHRDGGGYRSSSSVNLHCHAHHRTKAKRQHCMSGQGHGHGHVVNHPHDCNICSHNGEESVPGCLRERQYHRQCQHRSYNNNHGHNTRPAQRHPSLRAWGPPLPTAMMNCGH